MAANGEQPVRPHGTGFYLGVGAFASLAGSMFAWGVFAPDGTPFVGRLVRTGCAIVFLFCAAQSFERLFRPEKAQSRSSALSSSTRLRLRSVRRLVMAVSITAFAVAAFLNVELQADDRISAQRAGTASQRFECLGAQLLGVAQELAAG